MGIGILWTAVAFAGEPSQQSLIYDLMVAGEPVGHRKVTITYIPPTEESASGAREIESFTDIQFSIGGKNVAYSQQATGKFSDSGSTFVSVVSVNDETFEIQGKERSNNVWVINQILPSGIHRQQFSPTELNDISLSLFDPGQAMQWRTGRQSIYEIETGSVWLGDWSSLGEHSIQNQDTSVFGRRLRFHGHRGDWTGTWSTEGLLIDWSLTVLGVTVDGTLRSIPELPQFGEIQVDSSFGGVQEEEL